jgi:hypothetical protein
MQTNKPTTTSLVYAAVISNPGITSRELKFLLKDAPATAINGALASLSGRGALHKDISKGERSAQYSKGNAPVALNKAPTAVVEDKVEMFDKSALRQEIAEGINLLSKLLVKLEKI